MQRMQEEGGFTLIELMIVVVIIGLLAAIAVPNFLNFQDQARTASVKSNCHTVQLVSEDFSIRNDGVYPATVAAVANDGSTIIDLLPNGERLANPWTKANTEPVDGNAATLGQTGYRPEVQAGIVSGYIIEGYGKSSVVLTVSNG